MRKSYINNTSEERILVVGDDEHTIGMTAHTEYFFNCEPGEKFIVYKANHKGDHQYWCDGGHIDDLCDA